ncbi:hypothetical protein H257_03815 [Aphanomyces astaci]|uniref:PX domain-containing protein n=1 Tax=Aphanomyces astaci TaxID=112090 RepID=W4GY89_APHAT|nr:hypothetical protein H257_03815 [Aphanomyces astaci]ETV84685.1 hypothetical protein H257_03815 [Aphanomyces astaci]|eukprot:XP_009826377.1 hypothetical protein H257_03815 [Aphanomyces astaci]
MLVQSVHVIKFVNTVEKGKKATIYVAEVDDGHKTWTVDIRYSKFHEFHHALMKTDRNVVGKLPFPNKDLFSNQSPNHRQKELNKFVSQLLPLFQSLSMAAQIAFFELMEVPKHEFHATLVDTKDTSQPQTTVDVPEKRVSKQSISSTTTTELDDDNQRESLSDLSVQHIVEPLSPVASSRSAASPRHDPSEAETVDIPNNSNELLQVAVHHVDAVSERIHDVQGDPSTEDDVSSSTNDTEVLTETVEASGSIASVEPPTRSLLFLAVETIPSTTPERSLHAWEASSQGKKAAVHLCRYIIARTFRVLYPSLFMES